MDKKEIFISYRSTEAEHARWIKEFIEANNVKCWMAPDCIPGGSNYEREIPVAIENCKAVILVVSKKSQRSKWVRREVLTALKLGKIIIPFFIENCRLVGEFRKNLSSSKRHEAFINQRTTIINLLNDIYIILEKSPPRSYKIIDTPAQTAQKLQEAAKQREKELIKKEMRESFEKSLFQPLLAPFRANDTSIDKDEAKKTLRELILIVIGFIIFVFIFGFVVISLRL